MYYLCNLFRSELLARPESYYSNLMYHCNLSEQGEGPTRLIICSKVLGNPNIVPRFTSDCTIQEP